MLRILKGDVFLVTVQIIPFEENVCRFLIIIIIFSQILIFRSPFKMLFIYCSYISKGSKNYIRNVIQKENVGIAFHPVSASDPISKDRINIFIVYIPLISIRSHLAPK